VAKLQRILQVFWDYAGDIFGEKAYARYCDYVLSQGGRPMPPVEFYLSQQQRKYSNLTRCC
jgi:hypothetical protein